MPATNILRSIAMGASISFGGNFFRSLVQYLTKILGVDYALVGELAHDNKEVVNVISAHYNGRFIDNFSYLLHNSPCKHVVNQDICIFPRGVQKLFPQDTDLTALEAECYAGVPLFGSAGQPLGLLAVMDRKPLRNTEEVELVLQILAARAAAEIERRHVDEELAESHRVLSTLMGNLPGMVYRCRNDKDWTMEFTSDGCLELTGYSPEDFISTRRISYGQLIHAEDQELVWNQVQAGVREQRPFQLTYRITTAKGEQKWVWEQGRGVFSLQGELLVLEGFITDITERKRAEEIAARFGRVLDNSSNEIYVFDAAMLKFVQANEGARRNLGYSSEELAELTPLDLKPKYTRETFEALIAPLKRREVDNLTFETVHRRKNGSLYPVEVRLQLSYAENPPVFVSVILDITERKLTEEALRESETRFRRFSEIALEGIAMLENGKIFDANPRFAEMFGYELLEIIGKTAHELTAPESRAIVDRHISMLDEAPYEAMVLHKDGTDFPVEIFARMVPYQGRIVRVSVLRDITERRQAQQHLQFLAHHDALTSLPNRALFIERLNHALTRAHWTKRSLAVLFLDMDRFKNINDTLGHNIGDSALNVIAQRLLSCVREGDTVARLGGDEFTVLLEDIATADDVPAVAEKILDVLSRPFVAEGREFVITASVGISLYPNDGEDSVRLLRHADTAMYRAKEQGRNKYQFYSAEMGAKALEKFTLETNLRHALEHGEFMLHYQPQVSLSTGRIMGVEALLRWRHPELGMIFPSQFLSVAEETGLMNSIDEWVLRTACTQAQVWQSVRHLPLTIIVNLSGRTFSEPRLVEIVARTLETTGLAPGLLELEITENVVMQNAPATVETLEALSRMGVKLAIDDFGTGYSSLSYLKRFRLDTLKIDQSFVSDITTDEDDSAIVMAIIAMGKSLQLRVVAEGVETKGQLTFLREQGCDGMQGYLFNRPVAADETTLILKSGKKLF
jgi:diguanylate cyclase (GGDEF)-like protein/PAS domain S-box-containing protein